MFVLRRFPGSGSPKPLAIENDSILNKWNVLMWQTTTLETEQVQFFVMHCILVHVGTSRMALSAGRLRKSNFLCWYSTNRGIYCFNWLQLPSTLIENPHKKWWMFPLRYAQLTCKFPLRLKKDSNLSVNHIQMKANWSVNSLWFDLFNNIMM